MTETSTLPPPPPPPPPATRRNLWLSVALSLVIFVAGTVVGGGTMLVVIGKRFQQAIHQPDELPRRIVERMQRRLDLTPAQADRIQRIVQRRQQSIASIQRDSLDPQFEGLADEITGELTPDQARRWRRRFQSLREDWMPRRW